MLERQEGTGYILLHELTHVRRKDHMVLQLFTAAAVLHWFNPLAWLARRLMIQDMEAACDERVLELLEPDRRVEYAQTLLNWADARRHSLQYASFGQSDTKQRILRALNWKQLPRWAQTVLAVGVCTVFACTLTNPVLAEGHYLPVSSPFVGEEQRERFRAAAAELVGALEAGDAARLARLASMDPEYYEPVYAPFSVVRLEVTDARLYCNSSRTAEMYLSVDVLEGGGVYSEGAGTLVARLSQTGYRDEPFVSCLMPQKKYEDIRLLEGENEAVRLAVRLARNLGGSTAGFEAGDLSPVTCGQGVHGERRGGQKGKTALHPGADGPAGGGVFWHSGLFLRRPGGLRRGRRGVHIYRAGRRGALPCVLHRGRRRAHHRSGGKLPGPHERFPGKAAGMPPDPGCLTRRTRGEKTC